MRVMGRLMARLIQSPIPVWAGGGGGSGGGEGGDFGAALALAAEVVVPMGGEGGGEGGDGGEETGEGEGNVTAGGDLFSFGGVNLSKGSSLRDLLACTSAPPGPLRYPATETGREDNGLDDACAVHVFLVALAGWFSVPAAADLISPFRVAY